MTAAPWAPPEAGLGSSAARKESTAGPAPYADDRSERVGEAPRAVPLRPLTYMEILDHGFTVVRQRPRHAFAAAACVTIPFQLALALILRQTFAGDDFGQLIGMNAAITGVDQLFEGGNFTVIALLTLGPLLASLFASIALGQVVAEAALGRELGVVPMLLGAARRLPVVAIPWLVVHVAIVIGTMLMVIPGLIIAVAFYLMGPVAGVEAPSMGAMFSRPRHLARGKPWRLLAIWSLTALVFGILTPVSAALPWLISQFADPSWLWILRSVLAAVTALFTAAATGAISVVAYLDLRTRLEGLDLELATRALRAGA
mgnify:FL=1